MSGERMVLGVGLLAAALVAGPAGASVRREGTWPEDPSVTLDLDAVPRTEGIQKLAAAAGWSIVVTAPPSDPVTVHVRDQPAGKVLALLLADGDYVASRDGDLVAIRRERARGPMPPDAPAPPDAPEAADAPEAPEKDGAEGPDREVTWGDVVVAKGDTVHDVSVIGGNVDVLGEVTGDVSVVGGSLHVHEGAHIAGDAAVVGGKATLDRGAKVDGDAAVVGGVLERDDAASVGGTTEAVATDADAEDSDGAEGLAARAGGALARAALVFALGAILSAMAPERIEGLAAEVAARPVRCVGIGLLSLILSPVLVVALCATVVGIPVAIVILLGLAVAVCAGVSAALLMVGAALAGGRTKSAAVQLAVGCAVWLVVGALPWLGPVATGSVVLAGLGAVVATRGAGLFRRKAAAAA